MIIGSAAAPARKETGAPHLLGRARRKTAIGSFEDNEPPGRTRLSRHFIPPEGDASCVTLNLKRLILELKYTLFWTLIQDHDSCHRVANSIILDLVHRAKPQLTLFVDTLDRHDKVMQFVVFANKYD